MGGKTPQALLPCPSRMVLPVGGGMVCETILRADCGQKTANDSLAEPKNRSKTLLAHIITLWTEPIIYYLHNQHFGDSYQDRYIRQSKKRVGSVWEFSREAMKSRLHQHFFAVLATLAAGIGMADDAALPRLPDASAPQSLRRTHYVNPPIPAPVRASAVQQDVAAQNGGKTQKTRLDLGKSSPTAWTFDQVIAAMLTSDPRLRIGKEEIQQVKAEYVARSQIPNPEFSIEGGTLPFKPIREGVGGGPPELNIAVEFPIDWFLFAKRKMEKNSAKWEIQQAQAEYADFIRGRILETATLFYDVLEAKALFTATTQDIEILLQLEEIAKRGVAAGGMPVVELKRISLDLLQSRQELLKAEKELDILKAQLRAQFGCTDDDPMFDITGNLDAPTDKNPMPLEVAFEMAQQSRPDIRAFRMQVSKSKADVLLEKHNAYPDIRAYTGYTRQSETPENPKYDGWGIGVTVTVPLFDHNQGNRLKARSALAQSTYQYQAGIVDLRSEIIEADRAFRTAYQQVHTIDAEEVRLATEVRDLMVTAFRAGGVTLTDVLDAERSYRATVHNFITSRADYWRAMYVYNSVVGINSVSDVRAAGH